MCGFDLLGLFVRDRLGHGLGRSTGICSIEVHQGRAISITCRLTHTLLAVILVYLLVNLLGRLLVRSLFGVRNQVDDFSWLSDSSLSHWRKRSPFLSVTEEQDGVVHVAALFL